MDALILAGAAGGSAARELERAGQGRWRPVRAPSPAEYGERRVPLPLLFLAAVPALASWPYLFGSVAIHVPYNLALAYGYGLGDLSHSPSARWRSGPRDARIHGDA